MLLKHISLINYHDLISFTLPEVLLLSWMQFSDYNISGPYAFFEVFAGKGAATRAW